MTQELVASMIGVRREGESVLTHGDLSVLSFHATKVFNTFEGGAIVCPDAKTKQRIDFLKNFGFADEVTVMAPGINGKMNEFQAALGMLQLGKIGQTLEKRAALDRRYREGLAQVRGITLPQAPAGTIPNHAYFPVLIEPDYPMRRDDLYARLRDEDIFARRYFYPLIRDLPMYRGLPSANPALLPVAKSVSERILCLPIYPDLPPDEVDRVIGIVASAPA